MLTIPIAFIVGVLVGGITMYFVLKNNKSFLNTSLAELAAKALAKANAPSSTKKP